MRRSAAARRMWKPSCSVAARPPSGVLITHVHRAVVDHVEHVGVAAGELLGDLVDRQAERADHRRPCPRSRRGGSRPGAGGGSAAGSRLVRSASESRTPPSAAAPCRRRSAPWPAPPAKVAVDAHHLAGRLHLRAEVGVDAVSFDIEKTGALTATSGCARPEPARVALLRAASCPSMHVDGEPTIGTPVTLRGTARCGWRAG